MRRRFASCGWIPTAHGSAAANASRPIGSNRSKRPGLSFVVARSSRPEASEALCAGTGPNSPKTLLRVRRPAGRWRSTKRRPLGLTAIWRVRPTSRDRDIGWNSMACMPLSRSCAKASALEAPSISAFQLCASPVEAGTRSGCRNRSSGCRRAPIGRRRAIAKWECCWSSSDSERSRRGRDQKCVTAPPKSANASWNVRRADLLPRHFAWLWASGMLVGPSARALATTSDRRFSSTASSSPLSPAAIFPKGTADERETLVFPRHSSASPGNGSLFRGRRPAGRIRHRQIDAGGGGEPAATDPAINGRDCPQQSAQDQ